jgi:dTMP kinase
MSIFANFKTIPINQSILISLEGIEGCGKSTQIRLIESYLTNKSIEIQTLREPGSTKWGESLRNCILNSKEKIDPFSELLVFLSARNQMLNSKILKTNKEVILLDRYIDSTIAYQGFGRNLGVDKIIKVHEISPLNIIPHITFYLKIDIETSLKRQNSRNNKKDYFEKENNDFFQKVIDGFDYLTKNSNNRIFEIDATKNEDFVFSQIKKKLDEVLSEYR